MSNELQQYDNFTPMWQKHEIVEQIRKCFAPTLNEMEFQTLVEIGKATGLNPFRRELWAIKYGNKDAQIFVGRDGYRVSIGRNPNYESHIVDSVYENDHFSVDLVNGAINHQYTLKNRGRIIGAYCLVYMKGARRPYYVFCDFDEYNLKQSLWLSKPATMIKKVAEAQGIRMALPNVYAGTYSEDEIDHDKKEAKETKSAGNLIKNIIEQKKTEDLTIWIECIKNTQDESELKQVGEKLKTADLSPNGRNILVSEYKARLADLKSTVVIEHNKTDEVCEEAKEFFGEEGLV